MRDERIPRTWNADVHRLWLDGHRHDAIKAAMDVVNAHDRPKPADLLLQCAYYLFAIGDERGAGQFIEFFIDDYPEHEELLLNLAVAQRRSGQMEKALDTLNRLLAINPDNRVGLDAITETYAKLGQLDKAKEAGTRILTLKDQDNRTAPVEWHLPEETIVERLKKSDGGNVIAFSLWGDRPTYLRGALDNMLAQPSVYPQWTMRYYVDDTVPDDVVDALRGLGADIVFEPVGQSLRQKLAWRFKVANDVTVGRFLVRDVDSCVSLRERHAVDEWMASDRWFHVMRDWWSHTDLILAGMWGGIAGVLPDLDTMLSKYQAPTMEMPNIDQWFLRDCVWPMVRSSCLIHDRYFDALNARRWPDPDPEGAVHVGQDEYAAHRDAQTGRLIDWISRIKSLSERG